MDIAELLTLAFEHHASDLHLSAGAVPMIRVDGDMQQLNFPVLENTQVAHLIYHTMNAAQREDYETRLELDFSYTLENGSRFRVNAFHQARGAAAVFRLIPAELKTLAQLSAPLICETLCQKKHGLILVTGATGSGKSTTLAAMLDYINTHRQAHILTIEDPIEFVHESKQSLVNQREVKRDTHSFDDALRSALREDPDIILVGELRDLETIRLALSAAETGHLVLGTLHTSSAAKTIDRIIDVFSAAEKEMIRTMLSESLQAVIAQTLLPKLGGGRIAAHEIMMGTPAIKNLIREGKVAQMVSAMQTGRQEGMQTLDQCLKMRVDAGDISSEIAATFAVNKTLFSQG